MARQAAQDRQGFKVLRDLKDRQGLKGQLETRGPLEPLEQRGRWDRPVTKVQLARKAGQVRPGQPDRWDRPVTKVQLACKADLGRPGLKDHRETRERQVLRGPWEPRDLKD